MDNFPLQISLYAELFLSIQNEEKNKQLSIYIYGLHV